MTTQKLADLRAAPLFAHLDDGQLERFAALATPVEFPAEHTIFLQGDAAEGFFLLSAGRVKVFKMLRDGRTATVRHVEAGQTFAEAALFHEIYPSSTETMAESRLYRFDKRKVLDLLLAEPQLSVNLLAAMANLLGLLNRRVEELLLPVPARLARYLLALADEQLDAPARRAAGGAEAGAAQGPAGSGGPAREAPPALRVVRLPTTKRELAARLGTVPETLSRTFDRLKRGGVLRMSGDHELIEILDFGKLHRLAQD
jgi:CRP/FNR family transcriptional regulator, dissimilatory nitrate respiration regulator